MDNKTASLLELNGIGGIINTKGGVKISIKGRYFNGDEVHENYYADGFKHEDAENSNSYRINVLEPGASSVNILRFSFPGRAVSFFLGGWFDGKTIKDPFITIETNRRLDKCRKIISTFYSRNPEPMAADTTPIVSVSYNKHSRRIKGVFAFHPEAHPDVLISGEFDVKLSVIEYEGVEIHAF
jgi:hypothetical protein